MSRPILRGRLAGVFLLIATVLAGCGWFLYRNGLNLGLDLQGGMHLVLEVSDPESTMSAEAKSDAADRAIRVIRARIDEFGVAEPLIQKAGDSRIIVELPGVREPERAKAVVQRAAFLEFRMVRDAQPLRDAIPRMDRALLEALTAAESSPDPAAEFSPDPAAEFSPDPAAESSPDPAAESSPDAAAESPPPSAEPAPLPAKSEPWPAAAFERPGDDHATTSFRHLLYETGAPGELMVRERDVPRAREYLALPEVRSALPRGIALVFADRGEPRVGEAYRSLFVLDDRAFMTGEALEQATAVRDPELNMPTVTFDLNRQGARVFERMTGENVGRRMAILLDGEVVHAPEIRERIAGRGRIEMGRVPMAEAVDLALVLRAGALPAPLEVVEERTVGPSLGADAIERGRWAGVVATALVIGIMAAYYRMAGLLAVAALAAYVLVVLGALAAFRATLTVPGIAGLILSVGMAVDANVLIFERIREELAAGRAPRPAVDAGFRHAMSAIVDANLTTLVTALILFQFGTGPVRGFAVALSIGVVASFFTAVYVTRALFMAYVARKRATDPIGI